MLKSKIAGMVAVAGAVGLLAASELGWVLSAVGLVLGIAALTLATLRREVAALRAEYGDMPDRPSPIVFADSSEMRRLSLAGNSRH
jgi:hypothetical protein